MAASDFTPEARDRARRRYLTGATLREVAEQAGVTPREVRAMLRMEGLHPDGRELQWRRSG